VSRFCVFEKPIATPVPAAIKIVKTACALHDWLQSRPDSNYFSIGVIDNKDLENYTFIPGSWRIKPDGSGLIQLELLPPRFPDHSVRNLRNYYWDYFNGIRAVSFQDEMIR